MLTLRQKDELTLRVDGVPVLAPCIEIVLIADGPFEQSRLGYQAVFDDFRATWGERLRLCSTYDDHGMKPYVADAWSNVATWMQAGPLAESASFGALAISFAFTW